MWYTELGWNEFQYQMKSILATAWHLSWSIKWLTKSAVFTYQTKNDVSVFSEAKTSNNIWLNRSIDIIFATKRSRSSTVGDFRVAFQLCFKASPGAKPFIWELVLFTCKCWFIYIWIKLIFIWKASHYDSLWNRGKRQLGNHLLPCCFD